MDQKERKRKRALIVLQVVIYGYLLTMFLHPALHVLRPGLVGTVNLPLLSRLSGGKTPAPPDGSVSLEEHHDESRLAQRRADKWMIVGAALDGYVGARPHRLSRSSCVGCGCSARRCAPACRFGP